MNYKVGEIFVYDNEYSKRAQWCNENGKVINEIEPSENGERRFQIQEVSQPTQAQLNEQRAWEIKGRLESLSEDIVQDIAGEVVPNIEERKAEFIELHSELRVLLGKEPRELKGEQNAL